jgi:class 3 adenylate cyclase
MAELKPCPRCGHENDVGQSFCGACGNRLVLTCSACGASSPLGFRFCGSCGAQLESEPEQRSSGEERRIVSVIFVDLVGFTTRAEQLDPEDVRAMLTPYYACVREQIESFGGTVEKFIGDAVMGVFGAPVAHGDDSERAVRAALRVLDEIAKLNAADPDHELHVRIAVNTGEAIVSLEALTAEGLGMVAGDVVNTASRLQTAAPTNSILVGEATYRSTCSTITYEPVDPLDLKGKDLPVAAWRVAGAPLPPGERAAPDVPIVGREQELATLTTLWHRVAHECQPHLVTIFGLPGVGKTRLAAEFMLAVREAGGRVIVGRSLPYGDSGAYDAFAQQVKQVAAIFDDDPPDVAREKLTRSVTELLGSEGAEETGTHLGMMLGLPAAEEQAGAEAADRHALFFSARRFVEAIARGQPTLLVFQDLHWANHSLLDLLEHVSARAEKVPLMFLALARPELHAKRAGWGAGVQASLALPLEPLDDNHARELAVRLLARAANGELTQTAEEIVDVSEGNPLFIEELVSSVAERPTAARGSLPTSIHAIISARLDSVPAPERTVLLNAAVIGRIFWSGAVACLSAADGRLPELLDSLEGRDLIRREAVSRFQGHQQFRFKHALIREVAYNTLPRATRRKAHAAVATFLEEVYAERDSPATLGHHLLEAGEPGRAADYFVKAAEQASRGWAKQEAVDLYRLALDLVRAEDEERRQALRLKLAVAQQTLFHLPDAQRQAMRQRETSAQS